MATATFTLGDDLQVHRLGYGAMQITGDGVWGWPDDRAGAVAVLRRAVELGVDFIDTADAYGPAVSEDLIREALHPYDDVTIATKGGLTRSGPGEWLPVGRPAYLRQCVEMSLRRLDVDTIDLYQLHRIDPEVPAEDQFGLLKELQDEGKIRHVGLSQVSVDELEAAREVVDVVSIQNLYNLANRDDEAELRHCEQEGIAFIPWFPIATGELAEGDGALADIADELGASHAQVALAWLLHTGDCVLPIPGTKTMSHLEVEVAARDLDLTDEQVERLNAMAD